MSMLLKRIGRSMGLMVLLNNLAQAAPDTTDAAIEANLHPMAPAQMDAIRQVGRNILLAKHPADTVQTDDDQIQLDELRESLDAMISGESQALQVATVVKATASGQTAASVKAPQSDTDMPEAKAMVAKLRNHGKHLNKLRNPTIQGQFAAGFPHGRTRSRFFELCANKLERAINNQNGLRLAKLIGLRQQLETSTPPGLTFKQRLPSLKATPWVGTVPKTIQ